MQLIPAIDLRDGKCVRLRQGDYNQETIFNDNPVDVAKKWADQGAERIHLVDLDGARAGSMQNYPVVEKIVQAVAVPCQLGGGLRTTETIQAVLDLGIDRGIVGTQAVKQPDWFRETVNEFPGQIALGLDAKNSMVATAGWLDVSAVSAFDLAQQFADTPLAAIIYTNIANDGMMQGIDPDTLADLEKLGQLGIPIIASGGVTTLDDIRNLLTIEQETPNVAGAIIGRALYEGTIDLQEALQLT